MALTTVRLGSNNLDKARAFYDATFSALGYGDVRVQADMPVVIYKLPGGLHFVLGAPRDGQPATHSNGGTIGFAAPDKAAVDRWHSAGLSKGGSDEGAPGIREAAGKRYGAYLRDPDGHKVCVYAA